MYVRLKVAMLAGDASVERLKTRHAENGKVCMEESTLKPYLRECLHILFVGLNPATGSSRNGHYFSVNSSFWTQLYASGLIVRRVAKAEADEIVFGTTTANHAGWSYGITDLVTTVAESNSRSIRPTNEDSASLINNIICFKPKAVVMMHSKVRHSLAKFLGKPEPEDGFVGKLLGDAIDTDFFSVPFPHGNRICSEYKINLYKQIRNYLAGYVK